MRNQLTSRWIQRAPVAGLVLLLCAASNATELHWSFQPIRRPEVPAVPALQQTDGRHWPRGQLDHFVLARLLQEGLGPNREADRESLIRRVTLDLIGLPPTWDEVQAFVSDPVDGAYDRLVSRLLQSPRYGEHMAVPWLDLARYADTHGYHMDAHRDMWRWRDWVVDALNQNMAFDRFTVEQLAGDLLPEATLSQQIATGFHRNHMINFEDGSIAEEYRTEYVADRVATTSTVWLGLTMNCCRCHDHRYDPLTQEDFFRMFALFNNIAEQGIDGDRGNAEPTLAAPSAQQTKEIESLKADITSLTAELHRLERISEEAFVEWSSAATAAELSQPLPEASLYLPLERATVRDHATVHGNPRWTSGQFGDAMHCNGKTHVELADVFGEQTTWTLSSWVFPTTDDEMTLLSKSRLGPHARGFEITVRKGIVQVRVFDQPREAELRIASSRRLALWKWQNVVVTLAGSGRASGVQLFIDGERQQSRVLSDNLGQPVHTSARLTLAGPQQPFRGLIDEVRIFDRPLHEAEIGQLAGKDPLRQALATPSKQRSQSQQDQLRRHYLNARVPNYAGVSNTRAEARRKLKELQDTVPSVMVMSELPKSRRTFLLAGGRYDQPESPVSAGIPAFLEHVTARPPRTRLELARWMTHPDHPLVARVVVNRLWQDHFGRGFVATADDFGTQGRPPSHPELLDWLAFEFITSGWDVKHLQRLIVTSSTYRQSSQQTGRRRKSDPDNRWLGRMPRIRLPAEAIRDSALAVSGLLVEQTGGPGVFPYQPQGLWRELSYDPDEFTAQIYVPSRGADLYRRSVYTFWKRSVPPPNLEAFDAPSRETCVTTRRITNTPLQSLVLMNDPVFVEAARVFAERVLRQPGDLQERVRYAYRSAVAREPSTEQVKIVEELWRDQLQAFRSQTSNGSKLLQLGDRSPSNDLLVPQLAAWTTVASVLFQMDEFITRP
jgi:hypothetical protein